jgi:hypothetical protein
MTAIAVDLLSRPPEPHVAPQDGSMPRLDPDTVEFVADTDTLLTMCSCSGSSDQPYAG